MMARRSSKITPKFLFYCGSSLGLIACLSLTAFAATERGVMMREGIIYISPDTSSAKLSNIGRGREVAVIERTPGWVHVVGTVDVTTNIEMYSEEQTDRNVTGWIIDRGVITTMTALMFLPNVVESNCGPYSW